MQKNKQTKNKRNSIAKKSYNAIILFLLMVMFLMVKNLLSQFVIVFEEEKRIV